MLVRLWGGMLILLVVAAAQEKYSGPPLPKKDFAYLVRGDSLVEMEFAIAEPRDDNDRVTFVIAGAGSLVKTNDVAPAIVIDVSKLPTDLLQLYRVESRDGHREISIPKRGRRPQPVPMITTKLGGNLVSLKPVEDLTSGEYSLTPQGSNAVFCFTVN
jgi:hypothetical protein